MTLDEVLLECSQVPSYGGVRVISVHQRNIFGDTPLHVACVWGDPEPVSVLISAGADLNARGELGQTPLFRAITGKSVDVLKLLLRSGADKTIADDDGILPKLYASRVDATELAKHL